MKTGILLATVSAIALGQVAHAEGPSHVKVAQCSPLIRQELKIIVGHPLVILFPKGENVWLNPSSGKVDPNGIKPVEPTVEVIDKKDINQPLRNLFTVWPDAAGVSTLTVVVQTDDGSLKTYPFTLTSVINEPATKDDKGTLNDPDITLNLMCQNNPVPRQSVVAQGNATAQTMHIAAPLVHPVFTTRRQTQAEKTEAEDRLRTDAFNSHGTEVCHYHAKGKQPSRVEPMCPMDNGQWTLIRFKGLTRKPAVYIGTCEDDADDERLARQHGSGDFVVVEETAANFCLRLGSDPNDVLQIVNDKYDPIGNDPGTGTISPTVQRDVIQAKSH